MRGTVIVFVGPDPNSPHIAHAGGQLTATRGFAEFAAQNGIEVEWIDTAQSNFPVPPARRRIARAVGRLARFARKIALPGTDGAILFAGAGASFIERAVMTLVARLRGKPAVLMIRSGHFRTQYRASAAFRFLARLLLKLPHRVGVQGESWIAAMHEAGVPASRIVVVPNWLSHPAAGPRTRVISPGSPLRLLFAGWMTVYKGVPELIDAMRQLVGEDRAVTLTLAGGGTLLDQARAVAAEPALRDRLYVKGWLDRAELAAELQAADILVLPSHAEGFPNIVMEALAEGMPVIATPVGAIPDSVKDGVTGALVQVGDAQAIAAAVRSYLADPDKLERQSRAALETAGLRHGRDINCRRLLTALSPAQGDSVRIGG